MHSTNMDFTDHGYALRSRLETKKLTRLP